MHAEAMWLRGLGGLGATSAIPAPGAGLWKVYVPLLRSYIYGLLVAEPKIHIIMCLIELLKSRVQEANLFGSLWKGLLTRPIDCFWPARPLLWSCVVAQTRSWPLETPWCPGLPHDSRSEE